MAVTSTKLYNVKNEVLRKNIDKIGVNSDKELLMLEAPSEYKEIYRTLGIASKQDFVNEQLKDSRELKVYQDKYENTDAFKGHHIKKLCNSHDLMIAPISNIKGVLDENSMKAIKEFNDSNEKTLLSESTIYILAGRECFYKGFKGKPIKTFIIFYKDKSNESTSSSRRVYDETVVNQIYASGNDFGTLRVFRQLFLTKRYEKGDGMPRLYSNILISIMLALAILLAVYGQIMFGSIICVIYLVVMYFNNSVTGYNNAWNSYPSTIDKYV